MRKNFDEDEIELFRKVYAEGKADGEFDIDNVELVANITHYCIKGLEVPFIYGRLGHGLTEETSKHRQGVWHWANVQLISNENSRFYCARNLTMVACVAPKPKEKGVVATKHTNEQDPKAPPTERQHAEDTTSSRPRYNHEVHRRRWWHDAN